MYPRFIERRVKEALTDTRVVLITGPRQSGKTTLAGEIAGKDTPFLTLDDATTLKAASEGVVGIEVKASATVSSEDFSGMRRLAQACGDRFAFGMVLYDHDQIVPFGEQMIAAPLSCLW